MADGAGFAGGLGGFGGLFVIKSTLSLVK